MGEGSQFKGSGGGITVQGKWGRDHSSMEVGEGSQFEGSGGGIIVQGKWGRDHSSREVGGLQTCTYASLSSILQ